MTHTPVASMPSVLMLDACCVLNLAASRHFGAILRSLPMSCAVATAAAGESLWVERGGAGADAHERDPVDLQPLTDAGLQNILSIDSDRERAAYVIFAGSLDDGEAMTCAVAAERSYAVACDDRRVANFLQRLAPHVQVVTTPWLVKQWADTEHIANDRLRGALIDIRQRARYAPGRHDPLCAWWEAVIDTR
jgi:hypothetical protein